MIAIQTLRKVLLALGKNDHAFLGVRPTDAAPAEAPAVMLTHKDASSLAYAMETAEAYWPDCSAWSLIGTDELLIQQDEAWPPTMRAPRKPVELATF